jgi:hypothetical protein
MKNFSRKNKKFPPTLEWPVVPAWAPGTAGTLDPIQKCARTTRDEKFFTQKQKIPTTFEWPFVPTTMSVPVVHDSLIRAAACVALIVLGLAVLIFVQRWIHARKSPSPWGGPPRNLWSRQRRFAARPTPPRSALCADLVVTSVYKNAP